ncbi:MAG: hypothetical protein HZY77_00455 [Thiobacillus sp.]|nr:hypothetical protein [Thiobacillus sp.]QLQ01580.1 MAG: hypothetical protein HZY77_00455 [Thiobacillus sp.]
MGFLERMFGNLMRGGFGGHHGSYRGGHHGGSRHGGYGGNPGYPQDSSPAITCLKCGTPIRAMRASAGNAALPRGRQMFRLRRGTDSGRTVLRPMRQTPAVTQHISRCDRLILEERQHGRKT